MNTNIKTKIITDYVANELTKKYGISRETANSIINDINQKQAVMFAEGASFAEVAKYIINYEIQLDDLMKDLKVMHKVSDSITDVARIFLR